MKDIYWLAGFLEGEGCFSFRRGSPVVSWSGTDRDVILKACKLTGAKLTGPRSNGGWGKKPIYVGVRAGKYAAALMMSLYVLMGERRKEKILEALHAWKIKPQWRRVDDVCNQCGSTERYRNRDRSCAPCARKRYKEWRERNPLGPKVRRSKGPCKHCGSNERHASGKCAPCSRRRCREWYHQKNILRKAVA